ncbi:MAG: CotH kinase family protein [Bacteroidales bacterium]|nr:CotH kinase family protein [Bacteroidales bacterium]
MKRIRILLSVLWIMAGWCVAYAQILTDSNLPIVVIDIDGGASIPDEPRVYGNMKIIWHQDGSRNYLTDVNNPQFLNYDGRISIEIRGSSSQLIQKKQYGLTTLQADNVTNNNVSILGMPSENDWILNGLAYDQTGMRDFLSYELSERLGQYAPRRVYCEVVINNDYKGLYIFLEKIKADKDRVNIVKMDESCNNYPEVTGGYITKADRADNGDPVAWTMQGYGGGWWGGSSTTFVHHYPKPEDITTAQHNYIHNVFNTLASKAGSHDVSVTSGIPSVIDIPSFVDFMIMGEFSSNVDVYELSTFFHKDRLGKLRAGPIWDYNLAYGHDEFGNRSLYYVWQFDNSDNVGPKFWKDLFNTSLFRCYLAKRWFELTEPEQPLNYDVLCARIDEIDAWISEGVGRDNQRWHQMNQHASELQSMKTWIQNRIDWLNQNIGSYDGCQDVELPPLVISKIHYHPEDWWAIDGDQLEFIEITNNGDAEVDLTGIYFRELGITYGFPVGSTLAGREALVLCSDSLAFIEYYNMVPFGQFDRNLSNKSENLVLADAWGNIIDQVHYYDSDPWPWEADGEGPYLQLIDLDLDNSLPESWTIGNDLTGIMENTANEGFGVFPNPTTGIVNIVGAPDGEYRITNIMGQTLMAGPLNDRIDVSKLPSGIYFITIGDKTQKLIIS